MAEKAALPFAAATKLVMSLVFSWSIASHLAWSGPTEGTLSAAGLPSRVLRGEELQDLMPLEPLWDIVLPLFSLTIGTSLGALGMQLTLGLTFVQPLLLLLLPSFLSILENFHERLLAWHLGGIFGQPMLVAQVAIAHAERHQGTGCLKAFGVLVGVYTVGAVVGGLIRRGLQMLHAHQACARMLILLLVTGNLMTIWYQGHLLGHEEAFPDSSKAESRPLLDRKRLRLLKERMSRFLFHEVERALLSLTSCSRHLAARAAVLLGLTSIMGPAPLPALDLISFSLHPSHFAVFCFDLVGSASYSIIVPMLESLGDSSRRLQGLDLFFYASWAFLLLAVMAALSHLTCTLQVSMLAGLVLSSCCAVVSAVLSADMSEKAPHLADVGVRLAWGLFCGAIAQFVGAQLGQVLFLWSSWFGVCGFALCCLLLSRHWTHQALEDP